MLLRLLLRLLRLTLLTPPCQRATGAAVAAVAGRKRCATERMAAAKGASVPADIIIVAGSAGMVGI